MEVDAPVELDKNAIHTLQARLVSDTGEEAGKYDKQFNDLMLPLLRA